ncbi:MAG: hypothetical protein IJ305_06640, partial [Oscillospiraceae bacterium]|nr:hypothetical protein [Oscillospiraceae bacterium]
TTTTTKTTTTTSGNSNLPYDAETVEFINEVVRLTNEFRAENGVAPLTLDTKLVSSAMVRADEITEYWSHTRPDGRKFSTAIKEAGASYSSCGENIAAGQSTPAEVVEAWKNSTLGHREAMLNASYTRIGVGYVYASGNYWVQHFAG